LLVAGLNNPSQSASIGLALSSGQTTDCERPDIVPDRNREHKSAVKGQAAPALFHFYSGTGRRNQMTIKIKIAESITEDRRKDPRFQKLLADAESFFNSSKTEAYMRLLALHEAGHSYFARRSGATGIAFHGPMMLWDDRPQYDCPAISRSATGWTQNLNSGVVANIKADIGGFICRRELSNEPNDATAIEMDLHTARQWFDTKVATGDAAFKQALEDAEREILEDLKDPSVVQEIRAEAKRFFKEVFQTKINTPKPIRIKVGRNEPCLCGSGKKYKKCCLDQPSPVPLPV
jgi:hypothetical protein